MRSTRLRMLRKERSHTTNAHARRLIQCLTAPMLENVKVFLTAHGPEGTSAALLYRVLAPDLGTAMGSEDAMKVLHSISPEGISWDAFMDFVVNTSSQVGLRDSVSLDAGLGQIAMRPRSAASHAVKLVKPCPFPFLNGLDIIHPMMFYPTTKMILMCVRKRTIRMGQLVGGTVVVDPHLEWTTREGVNALAYFPPSHQLAFATISTSSIILLGLSGTHQVVTRTIKCACPQTSIHWVPKSPHVISGGSDGRLTLWKMSVGLQPSLLPIATTPDAFSSAVTFLQTFFDGTTVFACASGQIGVVRDSDLSILQYTSIASRFIDLCVCPHIGWIVTADDRGAIRCFPCADGRIAFHTPTVLLSPHSQQILRMGVAQAAGGAVTVSVLHAAGNVRVWDIELRQYTDTACYGDIENRNINYSIPETSGSFLFGTVNGAAYKFAKRPTSAKDKGMMDAATVAVGYDAQDDVVVSLHATGFSQWSLRTGLLVQRYTVDEGRDAGEEFTCGAFDVASGCLVVGTSLGKVTTINTASAAITKTSQPHACAVTQIVLSSRGNVVSQDADGNVVGLGGPLGGGALCDGDGGDAVAVGNAIHMHRRHHTAITSEVLTHVRFLRNGGASSSTIVCGVDNESRIMLFEWDRQRRVCVPTTSWQHERRGSVVTVTATAFHHASETLYVGDDEGFVSSWDATDGTPLSTWHAHDGAAVTDILVLESEALLVTVGADRALKVWGREGQAMGQLGTNRCAPYKVWNDDDADHLTPMILPDLPPRVRAHTAMPFFVTEGTPPPTATVVKKTVATPPAALVRKTVSSSLGHTILQQRRGSI